jgi:hypothetical protein
MFMLLNNADVNHVNGEKRTALHAAAATGQLPVARALVKFRANVDGHDQAGQVAIVASDFFGNSFMLVVSCTDGSAAGVE